MIICDWGDILFKLKLFEYMYFLSYISEYFFWFVWFDLFLYNFSFKFSISFFDEVE